MKVSYRTHPVIKIINDLGFLATDKFNETFSNPFVNKRVFDGLKRISEKIQGTVKIISEPFRDALELSYDKILDNKLVFDIVDKVGCMSLKNGHLSYVYDYSNLQDYELFVFNYDMLVFYEKFDFSISLRIVFNDYESDNEYIKKNVCGNDKKTSAYLLQFLLVSLSFIEYSEIEIKYLSAGQKIKGIDCKYVNDTKSNVQILDSKWFTTLVKSDAFKVRGHFRLQPKKKDGEWTKEFIWINEFTKEGYTAPARKLALA